MKKCVYLWDDGRCGVCANQIANCPCDDYCDDPSKLNKWEATYDHYHGSDVLIKRLRKQPKPNYFFWTLKAVLLAFLVFVIVASIILPNLSMGADRRITHYDKDGNLTGYTQVEDGKESHFDVGWNRSGYSIQDDGDARTDHYDRDWNRQGHDERTGEKTDEEM